MLRKFLKDEFINIINLDNIDFDMTVISRNKLKDFAYSEDFNDSILCIIEESEKSILVTLDGFDDNFEKFRQNTQKYDDKSKYDERMVFEIEWLCSLLEYVMKSKYNLDESDIFMRKLDFCLAIPHDRFIEIQTSLRDFFKFRNKIVSSSWSGPELVIMLRKRLEAMHNYTSRGNEYYDRLDNIIDKKCPELPKNIKMYINTAEYVIPLFQYVLRLSFWRPRDILSYYGNILASLIESPVSRERALAPEMVKRIIKETALKIIEDEFYGEYRTLLINLKDIIELFNKCEIILSIDELAKVINGVDFIFLHEIIKEFNKKITFLYEIGFLGVEASDDYMLMHSIINRYIFIFTEGIKGLRGLESNAMMESKFIIHPIFAEKLNLKINSTRYFCEYSWEYLSNLEDITMTGVLDYYSGLIN